MKEPTATIRLQFHSGFRFENAFALIPYFKQLGISHIYASPVLTARPGSTYGYDMVDPTCINPELGGEEELRRLAYALHENDIGLIVDFVPNHMAVGGNSNPWWLHLLEWGQLSPYARFFDINWRSGDPLLKGQLLVPFLRTDYAEVLFGGELPLKFCAASGRFYVEHFEHRFPIFPPTYADILERSTIDELMLLGREFRALDVNTPRVIDEATLLHEQLRLLAEDPDMAAAIEVVMKDFQVSSTAQSENKNALSYQSAQAKLLHLLLEKQSYRLASWRTAADDINWRRFFDINELGALRTERAEVFEAIHAKIFALVEQGIIDGLRIDHIDGLANPRAYCRKLRRRTTQLKPHETPFLIYVEKILADGEELPRDWLVDGTTGYEFMNQVSLIQHDPLGALQLHGMWHETTQRTANFKEEVLEARRLILSTALASDMESLAQQLLQIARTDLATRDLTLGAIRRALFELIAHFPVYRTYSSVCVRTEQEQRAFDEALAGAKASLQESDWPLLSYLDAWLGGEPLRTLAPGAARRLRRATIAHFQQITSPTAAKAVEDTACYRSAVLLSRNDVGFDPSRFSGTIEQFHQLASNRAIYFPDNLLATATHDHKRGEDTRARLAVISERSVWFSGKVQEWRSIAQTWRKDTQDGPAPSAGDELALYQILLGSWPLNAHAEDKVAMETYLKRVQRWQEKAIREAKLRSNWTTPNTAYETACQELLSHLLLADETRDWRSDLHAAAMSLAPAGALNSLTQTLLRLTSPGIPDLYQGCDLWDFSLVDPDNRSPVDYTPREAALNKPQNSMDLVSDWRSGEIKQQLICKTLAFRRAFPLLCRAGGYYPLETTGALANHLIAFARQHNNQWLITVAPRLTASLLGDNAVPHIPPERWGDTAIILPEELHDSRLTSVLNDNIHQTVIDHQSNQQRLGVGDVLKDFPVNLLYLSLSPEIHHAHQ